MAAPRESRRWREGHRGCRLPCRTRRARRGSWRGTSRTPSGQRRWRATSASGPRGPPGGLRERRAWSCGPLPRKKKRREPASLAPKRRALFCRLADEGQLTGAGEEDTRAFSVVIHQLPFGAARRQRKTTASWFVRQANSGHFLASIRRVIRPGRRRSCSHANHVASATPTALAAFAWVSPRRSRIALRRAGHGFVIVAGIVVTLSSVP